MTCLRMIAVAFVRQSIMPDAAAQDIMGQQRFDTNLASFAAAQVTVGPVPCTAGFGDHPHVQPRNILGKMGNAELGSRPMHAACPRLSHTPGPLRRPAPDLGQHGEEVLALLLVGDVPKRPRTFRLVACKSATVDPCLHGDQYERR